MQGIAEALDAALPGTPGADLKIPPRLARLKPMDYVEALIRENST
jgi:hypothetical protein